MKNWKIITLVCVLNVILLGFSFFGGYWLAVKLYDLSDLQATRFAISTVRKHFIRPVADTMIAKGVLSATQDPYSVFFTKDEFESFEMQLSDSYVGIGIMLTENEGNFIITKVFPDSPAFHASLFSGMMIKKVNAESVEGKTLEWVASRVRGLENTQVTLSIYSPTSNIEKEFVLNRKKVKLQTIESIMLENQVGYIVIHSFSHGTASDFSSHLDKLQFNKMKALILDLRDNGGGLLDETIQIAKRLLPSRSILFYTKGKDNVLNEQSVGDSSPFNLPLFVIVNQNSASASEVLAGAIQDHKIGKLVGETTFGKASIQKMYPNLLTGEAIKLTIQTYLTPNKHDLMEKGITPDIPFEKLDWSVTLGKDDVVKFIQNLIR